VHTGPHGRRESLRLREPGVLRCVHAWDNVNKLNSTRSVQTSHDSTYGARGFTCTDRALYGNLPKIYIDMNSSMSDSPCWRQLTVRAAENSRTLADLREQSCISARKRPLGYNDARSCRQRPTNTFVQWIRRHASASVALNGHLLLRRKEYQMNDTNGLKEANA
jgi:hypothetical protein